MPFAWGKVLLGHNANNSIQKVFNHILHVHFCLLVQYALCNICVISFLQLIWEKLNQQVVDNIIKTYIYWLDS